MLSSDMPERLAKRVDRHAHIRRDLLQRDMKQLLLSHELLRRLDLLEGREKILAHWILDELRMLQDTGLV